ncbi:MAG: type II toxin-antitoxin system death-on-curing family toxin [Gemmatimonadota bacterium]|nr:type II toxin-antitoxin system death-on-curing family toxin [Gemmatimonadota bacterium]
MDEPIWLTTDGIRDMHAKLIRRHGGSYGERDEGLIESALARPRQKWAYAGEGVDLAELAAAYAFGLAKNHGFVDGNKRIAFMAAYSFLRANGARLTAPEPEAYGAILALAAGELSEEDLGRWLRAWLEPTNDG